MGSSSTAADPNTFTSFLRSESQAIASNSRSISKDDLGRTGHANVHNPRLGLTQRVSDIQGVWLGYTRIKGPSPLHIGLSTKDRNDEHVRWETSTKRDALDLR